MMPQLVYSVLGMSRQLLGENLSVLVLAESIKVKRNRGVFGMFNAQRKGVGFIVQDICLTLVL